MRCVVEETAAEGEAEMQMAWLFAACCKNRRCDRSGHSPRERVFGFVDRMPGSALDSMLEEENPPGDDQARLDASYRRTLELRAAAQSALARLDHADR